MILRKVGHKFIGRMLLVLVIAGTLVMAGCAKEEESIRIEKLRVNHLENPVGIDEDVLTFSWQMISEERDIFQSAYQIMVAESEEALKKKTYLWDSGEVKESVSVGISYKGAALEPKKRYYWQVQVWDQDGKAHPSQTNYFETGLVGHGMPDAKWISVPKTVTEPVFKNTEYNISYQLEVNNTAAAFAFGAAGGRYGNMYLFEIENRAEAAYLRLKRLDNNVQTVIQETDISACRDGVNSDGFQVQLQVQGEELTAVINDTPVGSFSIEETALGSIGYFIGRGVTFAWLDDILVTDSSGNILYEEDFEGETNIFAPYYVDVKDGRMRAGSGLMLTGGPTYPAPIFRREFTLQDKEVASARIYMTALGSFDISLNGERVSEDYFAPGKPVYNKELAYVTYDVTDKLRMGEDNVLGITLLHGWYDRAVGFVDIWNPWGDTNALMGMLEVRYQDGTTEKIVTDKEFLYTLEGPVREDDIYQGEFYDATREKTGYDLPGYVVDETWQQAEENAVREEYLQLPVSGRESEPIRCVQILTPVSVTEPVENVFVYDFGQNFTGVCRIKVKGTQGQMITLRYGEAINAEDLVNKDDAAGTVWTENLLTAEATDYYVLNGAEEGEVFEPKYTFHGFRYLQITGIEEALPVSDVEGIVLSSDLEQTGEFVSSNEVLNRYYQNTVWSQRSNFMDNPMDCPQRDERHGWAGDAQVFSQTASYHMNTYAFFDKYLTEMRSLQGDDGAFPDMASRNFSTGWGGGGGPSGNNCWGDAPVVITWNLYNQYGDRSVLEENYEALCRWVDMLESTSDNYVRYKGGYADHLSRESTPAEVSDTAWCARSADLVSRMAKILGKEEDAEHYRQVYECFKKAWQENFVTPEGITTCDTQTSYALGLCFDLFSEEIRGAAQERLLLLAEYSGYHINTGFSGIGYLLPAFTDMERTDVAYRMLLQTEYPSLLFLAENGATTTWESFYSYIPEESGYRLDGSLNHYAFGAVAAWAYTDILGIQSDENDPGYHHILLEPKTDPALSFAKGSYESMYGKISSSWEMTEKGYQYSFVIPANTTATLTLPAEEGREYLESGNVIEDAEGVERVDAPEGKVCFKLSSGSYTFTLQ